ncbi:37S ribosomal protein subunit sws2, mitochondrial [Neolecta irregularis DAH-3]|uniref:Small ribosomal subunit protein uS13m n=1 Tax=Neolecta irregularis (strain DAH-3) TaxID=1198029 RepID=A0A1U7LSG2_NEOID|nr:37S ribosomal protein subunit sws2, mitochondrial [Neolecta irregularis DAH-3]|eukprot:OLL25482.1 37S ribosomal protein subunit sws2, mitochondrial [Neolecta irregularis DAH-3]
MLHLLGKNISDGKKVLSALQSFYGIGPHISQRILALLQIHHTARLSDLTDSQVTRISERLGGMTLENDLRRVVQGNIARLRNIGTYRGKRHAMGLPGMRFTCRLPY